MRALVLAAVLAVATPAIAETIVLKPATVTDWKAVYGRIEARDLVPARARIGGIVTALAVSEGDLVEAGQAIATVQDDKIAFQIEALDAELRALRAQLDKANAELERGKALVARGVVTAQRLEQLQTDVDVTTNKIAASGAQRSLIEQQRSEGAVLAPAAGRILAVPVTKGAVIMPGETVATLGGGGFYLRLAIPERHAAALSAGDALEITMNGTEASGTLVKIYPQIKNGRVIADVEVDNLSSAFVDARVLVKVPVAKRQALAVPAAAVTTRAGLDFVEINTEGGTTERTVITGEAMTINGKAMVEVLSGLRPGDTVVVP